MTLAEIIERHRAMPARGGSADIEALLVLLREMRDALAIIEQDARWLHDNAPDYSPDGVATLRDIARTVARTAHQSLSALPSPAEPEAVR